MKPGDLVKFVGNANFYKGRAGIVQSLYSTHNIKKNGLVPPTSALVYFAGAEGHGRDKEGLGQTQNGLHPMGLDELEVISEAR